MLKCYSGALFLVLTMLVSCNSKPRKEEIKETVSDFFSKDSFLETRRKCKEEVSGDFSNTLLVSKFIEEMVKKHGFRRKELYKIFSQAKRVNYALQLMEKQTYYSKVRGVTNGEWLRYQKKFLNKDNVKDGVVFWNQYEETLNRAWKVYGVPPEIIVGIIGVETRWGQVMGKTRILDALATLSFYYPRRAKYFSHELEIFLLILRNEKENTRDLRGSFAGAMGYCQFMPSSYKKYAVDFNGDGRIDLWDPSDAIGSVANYLKLHGWVKGDPVIIQAVGQAPELKNGLRTKYRVSKLLEAGLTPMESLDSFQEVSLLRFKIETGYQYWYGLPNFNVLTQYNHSIYYAMAVCQLGEAVAKHRMLQRYSFDGR